MARTLNALIFKSRPDIVFAWKQDSWPRGGAALALQRFFNFASRDGMTTFSRAS